jgi:hypothetical protein
MPDPAWTQQYQFNQSPEGNGFTRRLYRTPIVTEVTGGNPANRRVEIDSTNGDAVFITSAVPSLDSSVGATAEMVVNVTGAADGNAGVELSFLDRAVLLMVYPNKIGISAAQEDGQIEQEVATASNAPDTEVRMTLDASKDLRIYRNDALILGPISTQTKTKPFQRVLWWGESGALVTFRALRYYLGGAVIPG